MRKTILVFLCFAALAVCRPTPAGEHLDKPDEQKLGQPTDKEALVYFIRTTGLGAAIKFWAFADQSFLGVTQGKSYAFALVPEGKHLFWSKAENITTLEMEVQGGRTYYLNQEVRMGGFRARVRLSLMDEAAATEALKKCKYAVPTEEGRKKGEELVAEHWDKARQREGEKEKWDESPENTTD